MINIVFIIIGFIFLIKGADLLVEGASNIARKFKISDFVIGLTIIAVGTSLPELVVSVQSVIKGHDNLLLGNVIGSCIYNLLLILGIISIIKPIKINVKENSNIILMLISILIVGLLGNIYEKIIFGEGIMLILMFVIFILTTLSEKKEESKIESRPIIKSIIFLIIGIILLKYGGDFVVDNASNLARRFEIDEKIIGVTIVALGTSLPELATSIIAVRKNKEELAVGNIIGSNIFNILLVLGITSTIKPISFASEYNQDLIFLAIMTLLIIISCLRNKNEEINRKEGIILIIMFIIYNIKLLFI